MLEVNQILTQRRYWGCQAVGWGLYLLVTIPQMYAFVGASRGIIEPVVGAALGIALTHAFRSWVRTRGWLDRPMGALLGRVMLASMLLAVTFVLPSAAMEFGVFGDRPESKLLVIVFAVLRWTLVFAVWLLAYFGASLLARAQVSRDRQLRLEAELKSAELRALRAQVNPHFLFNTLNSLRALISDDPARARDAVTELAGILRYTLRAHESDTIALVDELRVVDDFLALESLRLGDRLVVDRTIDERALAVHLPTLSYLTLVENAIKHGVAKLQRGGVLRLSAVLETSCLVLAVENPRGLVVAGTENSGVGLPNVATRLNLLYGAGAWLATDTSTPDHYRVTMTIPLDGLIERNAG